MSARRTLLKAASSGLSSTGWIVAVLTGAVALGANSSPTPSSTSAPAPAATTMVVYAFSINTSGDGLIAAPGTKPGVVSVGDEAIINDQLTVTREHKGGYPIIGYDSGTCTFTRVAPDGQQKQSPYNSVFEACAATAVLPHGSIAAQGVVTMKSGVPQPATLAVTSGTGGYVGARGIVKIAFGKQHETLTFELQ